MTEILISDNVYDMNKYSSSYDPLLVRGSNSGSAYGFASANNSRVWVQNPATTASEVFADQFLGWVTNTWETNPDGSWTAQGTARAEWMNTNMTGFLAAYR